MRILALDGALARCSAAIMDDAGAVCDTRHTDGARDHAVTLPVLVEQLLAGSAPFDAVAVTVGPGSFTGLRAAIALAHGVSLGADVPIVGVTVAEALRAASDVCAPVWVVIAARRGFVYLDQGNGPVLLSEQEVPVPRGRVTLTGDAAPRLAEILTGQGSEIRLAPDILPAIRNVGSVGLDRLAGRIPPCTAAPLYVEDPRVTL
jgi:tRNA threonylcarbamoyladenosine biosynthesis protein TsaB